MTANVPAIILGIKKLLPDVRIEYTVSFPQVSQVNGLINTCVCSFMMHWIA